MAAAVGIVVGLLVWAGPAVWAQEALAEYQEVIPLKWGPVTYRTAAGLVTEDSWYAESLPTFAAGPAFSAAVQACLRECFEANFAADQQSRKVYRIGFRNRSPLQSFADCVESRACLQEMEMDPAPRRWVSGDPAQAWAFHFRYQPVASGAEPPGLEIVLKADGVAPGRILEVNRAQLWASRAVAARSGLTSERWAELGAVEGIKVYLVSNSPTPLWSQTFAREVLPDVEGYEVPLSFGVQAMDVAERISRQESRAAFRPFAARWQAELATNVSTAKYFPELCVPSLYDRLETGRSAADLVEVTYVGPEAQGRPGPTGSRNVLVLTAGPFRIPGAATVEVRKMVDDGYRYTEQSLARNFAALERELAQRLEPLPEARARYFWEPDQRRQRDHALNAIRRHRNAGPIESRYSTNGVVYSVLLAPTVLEGSVEGSYQPGREFGVGADVKWTRVFTPSDAFHVQAKQSVESTEGDAGYELPYLNELERRASVGLTASAGRDREFRLGGLGSKPFEREEYSAGFSHVYRGPLLGAAVELEDRVLWRGVELQGVPPGQRTHDGSGLMLRHAQRWSAERHPGKKVTWIGRFDPTVVYGPEIGWDESFWKFEVHVRGELRFGPTSGREMFVELGGRMGSESRGTPATDAFRLGETDRLFGLEPGEYSGRTSTQVYGAYGASLAYALSPVIDPRSSETNRVAAMLQVAYLKAVAEFATLTRATTTRVFSRPDETVSSYGLALELRPDGQTRMKVGLTLGYGWSPDSFRARGRIFSAVNWNF